MNADIFSAIGMHRPPGLLLPNIRTIRWQNITERKAAAVLLFASAAPALEYLSISFGTFTSAKAICSVINTLSPRTPHLKYLELRCSASLQFLPVKLALARWIRQLQNLKAIGIPAYFGRTVVVQALASLPCLQKIYCTKCDLDWDDDDAMMWTLEEGFQSLEEASFDASLATAGQLISSPKLPHLTRICLHLRETESEFHVHLPALLAQVATCASLEHLQLMLEDDSDFEEEETRLYLSYEHLRPLLVCRGLKQL